MRKFPSLGSIVAQGRWALSRFPLAIAAAGLAAVIAVLLVDSSREDELLLRLLTTAILGIPLFFALSIFVESREGMRRPFRAVMLLRLAGIVFLAIYYFTLPRPLRETSFLLFVQLAIGLHLLVAFLPYLRSDQDRGFWQYNKTLFLRFLAAAIFSLTLFAGLSVALLAIDELIGIDIDGEVYPRLFFIIAFVFNTWYFAGGIPERLRDLNEIEDYPKVLKIFAQHILAPLVAVYLAILTIYLVKVVVTTQWPSGWIGYLVSSVAVAGILSLALLDPLVKSGENGWIRSYSRAFYVLLLPAIVMVLMAIFKRIAQYGVTERRYLLTLLALWLAGIALYFIFSRRKDLKLIPISLCLVVFGSAVGPWGAYDVSERSQKGRLEKLLIRNQRLADGQFAQGAGEVPLEDRKEMSAIVDYLLAQHGTQSMAAWYGDSLRLRIDAWQDTESSRSSRSPEPSAWILESMGCRYLPANRRQADSSHFYFSLAPATRAIRIEGYELSCEINCFGEEVNSIDVEGDTLTVRLLENERALILSLPERDDLVIPLAATLDALRAESAIAENPHAVPLPRMTLEHEGPGLRAKLIIRDISWRDGEEEPEMEHLMGTLLLDRGF